MVSNVTRHADKNQCDIFLTWDAVTNQILLKSFSF